MQDYVTKILSAKDDRMKVTSETFNSIKLLKLYGWESEFLKRVCCYKLIIYSNLIKYI